MKRNVSPLLAGLEFARDVLGRLPAIPPDSASYWADNRNEDDLANRLEAALSPPTMKQRLQLERYYDIPELIVVGPNQLAKQFEADPEYFWQRMPKVPWRAGDFRNWLEQSYDAFLVAKVAPSPVLMLKCFPEGASTTLAGQLRWPNSRFVEYGTTSPAERLFPDLYNAIAEIKSIGWADEAAGELMSCPIRPEEPNWEVYYLEPPVTTTKYQGSYYDCEEVAKEIGLELATAEETLAVMNTLIIGCNHYDLRRYYGGLLRFRTSTPCTEGYHLAVEAQVAQAGQLMYLKLVASEDDEGYQSAMFKGYRPQTPVE